jgi:hypothetical protein
MGLERASSSLDKPWDLVCLSMNPNITWDIVQSNTDKPWVWWALSRNPNITWDIVKANPDKPWDWWGLEQFLDSLIFLYKSSYIIKIVNDIRGTVLI